VLWLAGTLTALIATYSGIRCTPVRVRTTDGTTLRGMLYRSRAPTGPEPAAVVLHGTAGSHASCAPGLAVPLAPIGFSVLPLDLRGHGRSEGTLALSEYDDLATLLRSSAEQPEVEAAIDFLRQEPGVDRGRLALVGHSRGGWMAAVVGCRRPDVGC